MPLTAVAQTAATNPPPADKEAPGAVAPTPPPPVAPVVTAGKSWRDLVTLEGLVDSYYSYRPGGAAAQTAAFHVFDAGSDAFVLAYTELALSVKTEPVGLRVDYGFGPVADLTASTIPVVAGGGVEVFKHLQQAYVSFALPTGTPLTIDVGKFVTPAGAEVIEARSNWNYSRSFLFGFAIPFTHTGVRLTAPLSPMFTVQAMVVNGWDIVYDFDRAKTFGLSLTFNAPTGTTIILNGIAGEEQQIANAPWRLLADLVITHTMGPLGLMVNADVAKDGDNKWYGGAAYARLTLNPNLNLALRGEVFKDAQGFRLGTGVSTTVEEFTVTAGFPIASNAELRAEFRGDFSGSGVYAVDTNMKSSQFQLLAAALAWF